MEEVLKGLEGKSLTKKKLFDFLADINLDSLKIPVLHKVEKIEKEKIDEKKVENVEKIEERKEKIEIVRKIEDKIDENVENVEKEKIEIVGKIEGNVEIKCEACTKTFINNILLKKHHEKNQACVKWISFPQKSDTHLKKGLHLIIDDLLKCSISIDGKLECKHCSSTFTNNGNLHKHFNTSTVCNRLAYQEFKSSFNSLDI
jgi:hypothetical protein